MRSVYLWAVSFLPLAACAEPRLPIIDMHLHVRKADYVGKQPPPMCPPGSALVTFWLPDAFGSAALRKRIREKHAIQLKVVLKNWFNGLRVSTLLFNSAREVDALVRALKIELA